jgi:hypothetical protein
MSDPTPFVPDYSYTGFAAGIASQPKAVQIAYEYSGTFVKSEPMMQAGFTALGFTEEQLDNFLAAASQI